MRKIRLIITDGHPTFREELPRFLVDEEGLELVKQQDFALVFLDLKVPGMDGAELFRQMKTIKPHLAATIITDYPNSDMMTRALAQGSFGVMKKPFRESGIIAAVNIFCRLATAKHLAGKGES